MKKILILLFLITSTNVPAVDFEFVNISEADLENIVGDFSAATTHSSVSDAETLGDIWGFELGMQGGVVEANEIDAIFTREGVTADANYLPHGTILGRLSIPMNITLELGIVPKVGNTDFKFSQTGGAVMWTPDTFLPLDLAVKGHISKSDIRFAQQINSVDTDVDYSNTVMGVDLIASRSFLLVDPYVGVGYVEGDGDMTINGTDTFFNFTSETTAGAKKSGVEFFIGVELDMLINVGLEYAQRFGESSYSAKFSFGF